MKVPCKEILTMFCVKSSPVFLSVTLVGNEGELFLSAIAAGGSQAIFFKINTFGEEAFLNQVVHIVERYQSGR